MLNNPKKELGQHWLHDSASLEAIVEVARVQPRDVVLEIGPGLGTLTDALMYSGALVTALEFDRDLLSGLRKKYTNNSLVKVEHGDVRTFDFRTMPEKYKVVANIPYYLTSHLIRSLSESENPPELTVLLIQKEVAKRLCAEPGDMSILALTAQFYSLCRLDIEVPASLFTPPPKVDSQVVVLERRHQKLFDVDEKQFFTLVKAGFSEKRKTLRNTLSGGLREPKDVIEAILSRVGIDSGRRPQELALEEWYAIYKAYEKRT